MQIKIKLDNKREKDVNLRMQKWEGEGGQVYDEPDDAPANREGLLKNGQRFEVLDTHLERDEDGRQYQVVEIKPLEAEKRM